MISYGAWEHRNATTRRRHEEEVDEKGSPMLSAKENWLEAM